MRRTLGCTLLVLILALPARAAALGNAGFDVDLAGWTTSLTSATWDPLDVAGSASSGSARLEGVGALAQCLPVGPGAGSYEGGASAFVPSGQTETGMVDVAVVFFDDPGCAGFPFNMQILVRVQPDPDVWTFLPVSGEVPEGASSAHFRLEIDNPSGPFVGHFDGATLSLVPAPGASLLLLAGAAAGLRRSRHRRRRRRASLPPRGRRP